MEFTVKPEHIKLLKRAYVRWEDCEYGAPAIDCKRPYGNSYVIGDMAEILGIKPENNDEYEPYTRKQERYMADLHKDLETVLQIFLRTGKMKAGTYVSGRYGEWKEKKNVSNGSRKKSDRDAGTESGR